MNLVSFYRFGNEQSIELLSHTIPFPDIETHEEDGYFYLAEKDAQLAADKFRGMQRDDDGTYKPLPPDIQQDEAQIVLTTLAK